MVSRRHVFAVALVVLMVHSEVGQVSPHGSVSPVQAAPPEKVSGKAELVLVRLKREVTVQFANTPLRKALAELAESGGINISIDKAVFSEQPKIEDSPITLNLARNASLESALRLILAPLHLVHFVRDGAVVVTTQAQLDKEVSSRKYVVADLASSPAELKALIDTIRREVNPGTWDGPNGKGTIQRSSDNRAIVVVQTRSAHEEIADLIDSKRRRQEMERKEKRGADRLAAFRAQRLRDASELTATDIWPHPEGAIKPGRNYVYCATFQMAWTELQEKLVKGPVQLEGDPPAAAVLNRRKVAEGDLSPRCYLAMAGTRRDNIATRIREAVHARFPDASLPVPSPRNEAGFLVYAYLFKRLPFAEDFERLPTPLLFRGAPQGDPVASFGIERFDLARHKAMAMQVTVLEYRSDEDFILKLDTHPTEDEIVLAKVKPMLSLQETVRTVRERIRHPSATLTASSIQRDESLIIPILSLHVERDFPELVGRAMRNPGLAMTTITKAIQGIRFRLDEQGAILESYGELEAALLAGGEPPRPRQFVFDKPFLIYLREPKGKEPYLAMFIANSELMERVPERK
jgi:hypothetical protein